jgi:acetyl-CoA synthetase
MSGGKIDTVMLEERKFPPPAEFASRAVIGSMRAYEEIYERAQADPEKFWGDLARQELHWFKPFEKVLQWNEPFAKWFVGGQTNAAYNCLDAHLTTPRRDKTALIWEGEPGEQRRLTYAELHREVCRFANALKA